MDAKTFDKSKLPSRHVTEGPSRPPHRSRGFCIGHVGPEAAVGGLIALVQDGDIIAIDAEKGTLDVEVPKTELAKRRKAWQPPANPYQSGAIRKYADQVGSARKGAATHAGGKAEVICYADI